MKNILLALIVLVNGYFIFTFVKDLIKHKDSFKEEKASTKALPFSSFIIFFFSTFGISDFAISSVLYPKLDWVSIKKLPGTLNAQCVVPVAVMALSYITSIDLNNSYFFYLPLNSLIYQWIREFSLFTHLVYKKSTPYVYCKVV